MTVDAREFLVFVAIVTSAIVLRVSQQNIPENLVGVSVQPVHEKSLCNPAASAFGDGVAGRLRANCQSADDVRGVKATPKARIQLWV